MERGLTMADIKRMQIVDVVEFCDDYNKRNQGAEKSAGKSSGTPRNTKRAATQAEIDAFLA